MDTIFQEFLDTYIEAWKNSSLTELKTCISKDYKAREITGGEVVDFGYEESISGWEQGFHFVKENDAEWDLQIMSIFPIRKDEFLVIISATIVIQGKRIETANLFFQTFKRNNMEEWSLVRSYIEAGIPSIFLNNFHLNNFVK